MTLDEAIAALQAEKERLSKHCDDAGNWEVYLNSTLPLKEVFADTIEGVGDVYINLSDGDKP